ncbi:hypothetical protein ACOMHN_032293 [Nucella lapillus]
MHSKHFTSLTLSIPLKLKHVTSRVALCEIQLQSPTVSSAPVVLAQLQPPWSVLTNTQQTLGVCPNSQATHAFWEWDFNHHFPNFLNSSTQATSNTVFHERQNRVMFQCSEDQSAVQYSVVCDFRPHCPDSSDESFCEFPPCGGFPCSRAQCIPHSQRCNEHSDCLDDSDERDCPEDEYEPCEYCVEVEEADETRMLYKNLDGTGYFTQKFVAKEGSCGDTHYRCTSELFYCLPVYTRCNGFSDCVYGEDEQDCKTTTCPGLYRCRSSTVCVHGHHLCDGWGQCPQRDDELMCDMACPEECLCSGHSFLCAHSFPPQRFPDLRYRFRFRFRLFISQ